MFGGIARRYDLLNRLLSLTLDERWRRSACRDLAIDPRARILDLCGGTGDLTAAAVRARPEAFAVCCDFALPMLEIAGPKLARRGLGDRSALVLADGLHLPFRDQAFDAVTIGFGLRNLVDRGAGLSEIRRVLKPGGVLVVLEFSAPTSRLLAPIYRVYLNRILPRVGGSASGRRGPYDYLARTIGEFPEPAALAGLIREAGFAAVGWTPLTGGIVCVHKAFRSL